MVHNPKSYGGRLSGKGTGARVGGCSLQLAKLKKNQHINTHSNNTNTQNDRKKTELYTARHGQTESYKFQTCRHEHTNQVGGGKGDNGRTADEALIPSPEKLSN